MVLFASGTTSNMDTSILAEQRFFRVVFVCFTCFVLDFRP